MPDAVRIADRYEVIRPLGRGAFAETLLARDVKLNRKVALKVLHPRAVHEWKAYELFEREAAVLKELRHPSIPVVHEAFRAQFNGTEAAFLAMEFIDGTSVGQLLADHRHLEPDDVRNMFVELLGVLDYLHSRVPPVLHRDIKPANIILRPGGAVALVDFGAVRNVFRSPDDSGSTVVGTYGYMPYEQYMGQASPASDLYALGATLLHLITGRAPPEFMSQAGRLEVPATLSLGEPTRSVLARLLQPAAADRFQAARDARNALLGGPAGVALVPAATTVPSAPAPPFVLPAAPRALSGDVKSLYKHSAYGMWDIMNSDGDKNVEGTLFDFLLIGFFSVITAGIMPVLFFNRANARRKRMRPFFIEGIPVIGQVVDTVIEKIEFEARLARVRYHFEADGRRRLGSDRVMPRMADLWEPGTEIRVLYLPQRDYDSVIVGSA